MHETWMQRCLELAAAGMGKTAPNPMVGSVVVHRNRIIGEGFHQRCGGPHAEVNAIASVTERHLLPESTLYVNLEPCNHFGKTPPCTHLILESGIRKVVVACQDPNPQVGGSGIRFLIDNGCELRVGVLEDQARWLNRRFMVFHTLKRPYIVLKWAQSADGFIDRLRNQASVTGPNWITPPHLRMLVHKWRSEESAIWVGRQTVVADNPRLNLREWPGTNPLRVIMDSRLSLPENSHVLDQSQPTVVFNETKDETIGNIRYIRYDQSLDTLQDILSHLYRMNILSVLVEGGSRLLQSLIDSNLWDEARVFSGDTVFGSGVAAPRIRGIKPKETLAGRYPYKIFINPGQTGNK